MYTLPQLSSDEQIIIIRGEEEKKRTTRRYTDKITNYENWERYNIDPPTSKEIKEVIKKLKRRKAPGPDEIPTEILKEMDDRSIEEIRRLMKTWWQKENIGEEEKKRPYIR